MKGTQIKADPMPIIWALPMNFLPPVSLAFPVRSVLPSKAPITMTKARKRKLRRAITDLLVKIARQDSVAIHWSIKKLRAVKKPPLYTSSADFGAFRA